MDNLFALSPDHYRDFDGVLYATDGGRGSNLYLLDKTVAAEQVDEDHWTVTVTFWADFEGRELQGDGYFHTVATTGYSTAVLDYAHTPDGWKFTGFVPRTALNLEADTVYTIHYYQDFEVTGAYQDYSDWKLACYLIYADGAYAEAPFDLLARRFLERPEDILHVLALLDSSPTGRNRDRPIRISTSLWPVQDTLPLGGSTGRTGRTLRHSWTLCTRRQRQSRRCWTKSGLPMSPLLQRRVPLRRSLP